MGEPGNGRLRATLVASVAIVMVLTVLPSVQSSLGVTSNQLDRGKLVTSSKEVAMTDNQPPVISIQSSQWVNWGTLAYFTATASDADNDTLRFTWDWGDGSTLVTYTPTNVSHMYAQKRYYNLYVYADDLSGLPGHNVSALDVVRVADLGYSPPYGLTLSVNASSIWASQSVSFTATAQDPTGDGMRFSISCGDGTYINIDMPGTANNAVVIVTAVHTYVAGGLMTARLYVTDGLSNTTDTLPVYITVTLNHPPMVTQVPAKTAWAGSAVSFSVSATDQDGDPLRYTWNFGDGTWVVGSATQIHIYAKAGMYNFTVYVDDQTGLVGHNVSSSATASIAFNLNLVAGWNLVSLPLSGYGYKASTLGLATGDVVVNTTSQPYHPFIVGISPGTDNFAIAPNTGYWIWVAASKTLHIYGSVPTTMQVKTYTVPASGGWVTVGFLGFTTRHASDIPKMWNGTGRIIVIAKYDPWLAAYVTYIPGTPLNDFVLVPGQAYWCWATSSGTLSYMP